MLPDEVENAAVLQDGFEGTIGGLVHGHRAANGHIVDVWYSILGNFWLKDMQNVIMEYRYCMGPTHWEFGQTECTIWCSHERFQRVHACHSQIQVEHPSAGATCELLLNLFREWSDIRILDCDSVEGFKAMDWVKGFSLFLGYPEPV